MNVLDESLVMIRLLLVEDHVLVRQSICAFLESKTIEVVGEASNGIQAIQLASTLEPDLIIMDIHLPYLNGIEATRQIRQMNPSIHIIALTAYNQPVYQRAIKQAGADAFVLKTAESSELLAVIYQVMEDTSNVQVPIMTPLQEVSLSMLTQREMDVLQYLAVGWHNKKIGLYLDISSRTVQTHLQAIYQKLQVTNRTEAVLRGIALGIIQSKHEEPK